jgi:hypothetical protein
METQFMKAKGMKPGQIAPESGIYEIRGPRGGHGPERTVVAGETLPPTPAPGSTYDMKRPARNGAGERK